MSDEYPRFLTVAVGAQVPYDPTFTEEVQKAAHLVSEAFSAFRGSVEILGDDSTAHRTAMETWLGEWGGHPQRGEIIYWTGHGRSDGDTDYYLGLGNSTYLDETDSLSHDYLAKALRRHQDARKSAATEVDGASWLVLVVDACDSYVGVPLLARKFPIEDQPDNLLILSTGVRAGEVFAGAFAVKLASKLKEVTGNQAKGISVNELFLDRMGADVVPAGHIRTSNAVLVPRHAEPLAGTLEAIRSLEEYLGAASPELRNHFYAKARGAEQNEPGWYFVGRSEERATVANWLDEAPSGMLIITGDPGTGKSALIGRVLLSMDPVLEDRLIANRLLVEERHLRPQWPGVEAVIHLRGARLEDTVRAITTAFKMKTDRPKRVAARIAAKAASLGPRTIVVDALDEAADPAGIAAFLTDVASRPGVRVIVGTRARAAHPEAVDLMDALGTASAETVTLQHSTELDRRRYTYWRLSRSGLTLGSVNRLATEIARKFDSLLVIRMVLAEIAADPTLTADPYEALAVLRGGADQVYQHMLQRIAAAKPASALALRALAFAHGMGIPRDNRVWETAATTLGRLEDRPTRVNDDDLSWVLQHLPAYVLEDSAEGSAVYRLAHQTLTDYLLTGAPSDLADRLDRELASALLGLTPYSVYLAAESMSVVGPEHPDTLTAQANLAASYRQAGRTTDAITILEKVAADRVRILGPEHPDTLTAQANLAASYWQAGRTTDAITILEKVAADRVRILGPEHPDTLTAQANLAVSYWQAGRTADAITILEKVAAEAVRILGPEHPDTLTAQANLAASYWQAGRTTDAITILETVAADRVRILGPEHPGTLTAQANLAVSYRQAGRATDAITILEKVAAETVRILGPEHPDTLTAQANLAASYRQAGRTTDAITILETVAAETVRILGPEHPDTLTAQANLAASYWQAGRTTDAITILEKVAADRVRILGPEHPDTLTAQANLAASYWQAGRTTDAITILEKVAAEAVRILGPEHPDTLTAQANLAASYWQAGRTTDAITILETVAADRVRILGPEHPGTLTAQANLAVSYRQAGRTTDAITILEKVAAETVRILGPEHPDTLTAQANLAVSYRQAGRTADAITILETVAADRVRILGPEHPGTLTAQANLAASYRQAGRATDAITIEEKVAAETVRILGPEHPDTLTAQANLAASYRQAGRTTDAITIEEKVAAETVRILGPEHPDTKRAAEAVERWADSDRRRHASGE